MPDNLAKVALPFSTGTRLRVAETVSVEGPRTVITTDQLAWLLAYATLDHGAFRTLLMGHLILVLATLLVVSHDCTAGDLVEQALLEHIETLHVDFLKDKLRVVPRVNIHHVFVGDGDSDGSAWSAHQLWYVQVPAKVILDNVLVQEAKVEHGLVVV